MTRTRLWLQYHTYFNTPLHTTVHVVTPYDSDSASGSSWIYAAKSQSSKQTQVTLFFGLGCHPPTIAGHVALPTQHGTPLTTYIKNELSYMS